MVAGLGGAGVVEGGQGRGRGANGTRSLEGGSRRGGVGGDKKNMEGRSRGGELGAAFERAHTYENRGDRRMIMGGLRRGGGTKGAKGRWGDRATPNFSVHYLVFGDYPYERSNMGKS